MSDPIDDISSETRARRRLYIHIGAYKTGTTSIQYLLSHNRPHLHGYGVYYPSTGRHPRSHVQHALLAHAFLQEPQTSPDRKLKGFGLADRVDRDLLMKALRHEIDLSGCRSVILSSEVFYSIPAQNIASLFRYFPDYDVIPILFIRNLVDMAETFYQTALVHGTITCTFEEYGLGETIALGLYELCRAWAAGAMNGKIIVQDYDAPHNSDVVESFLRLTGLEGKPLDRSINLARHNQSFSPAVVTLVRELRRLNVADERIRRSMDRLAELDFGNSETVIPDATRQLLHDRYLEERRKLSTANFVQGLSPEDGFERPLPAKNHIHSLRDAMRSAARARIRMRQSAERMSDTQSHHRPSM